MSTTAQTRPAPAASTHGDRTLLLATMAGPIFAVGGAAHALLRDGFDPTRHSWSLLANGDLGWLHQTMMILTGLLAAAGGLALRRRSARASVPRLVTAYGVLVALAGVFRADPMDGFPAGTPEGLPASMSVEGVLHMVSGSLSFGCLIAACLIVGHRRRRAGVGGRASTALGLFHLAAFVGVSSGAGHPLLLLAFVTAVLLGWAWLTRIFWTARSGQPDTASPAPASSEHD